MHPPPKGKQETPTSISGGGSFGTIVLFLVQLFFGKGELLAMFSTPKWQLTGGILGAFYVFVMVLIVPKVGVANSLAAVIAGQLVMSSIIDHFGLFGGQRIPFDMTRLAAIACLFLALWLFFANEQQDWPSWFV
ncbi:DMT family transporter [Geobacillus stearothermophilus]|uniref:DMT family transporter n=1 Tax=Geobacillus stearothermophilus TaxID=1422 RepID=UPI003D24AB6C